MKTKLKTLLSALFGGVLLFLLMLIVANSFDVEDLLLVLVIASAILVPFVFFLRQRELKPALLLFGLLYLVLIFLPVAVIVPPLWKKVAIAFGISYCIYLGSYLVKALADHIREKNPARFDKRLGIGIVTVLLVAEFLAIWALSYLTVWSDSPLLFVISPFFAIALYIAIRASGRSFSKPSIVYAVFYTLQQLPLFAYLIFPEGFADFLFPSEPSGNSFLAIDFRASFFLCFVVGITCLHLAFDLARFLVRVIKKKQAKPTISTDSPILET